MKRFFTFLKTELKLSVRDMNMPIFAVIMPLVIFVILGVIYGGRPSFDGAPYTFLEQSFGAVGAVAIGAGVLRGVAGRAGRHRRLLRPCRPLLPVGVNGTEALFARPRMGPRFSCAPLAVFAPRKARYIHYNVYPVPVYHRIPRCPLPPPARRERRAAQVCLAERTI